MLKVDREFYVMQGEFYTKDRTMEGRVAAVRARRRRWRMNARSTSSSTGGRVAHGRGDMLEGQAGEKVRLYVGNGGPNLMSSFHIIGAVFDKVYSEAAFDSISRNVQTTLVPAGGAAVVELEAVVRGGSCWWTTASRVHWTRGRSEAS